MRFSATVLGVVAATSLALAPLSAAPGPGSKPQKSGKPVAMKPATGSKPATSPKMTSSKPTQKPTSRPTPKSTSTSTTKRTTTTVKPAAPGKPTKTTATASTTSSTTTKSDVKRTKSTTTPTTTANTTTLNPIAAKIASKPNLNSKLTGMLPIDPLTGKTMTLDRASLGFKNQGQFIAALHVSENLGIPFTELKSHMVTVTPGAPGEQPTATQTGSLGQAIQKSKATADVTTQVRKAEQQAAADLQTPTTTTTPKGGVR